MDGWLQINSADALVLTELILENTLAAYDPAETVALLSAFVFTEKSSANNSEPEPLPTPKLDEGVAAMLAVADRVGSVQERLKIEGEDVYVEGRLGFGLVEVVYEWAKGMPFEQITALTEVPEGTIVRVITRLDEVCREVRDAGRVIGDAGLMKKMEEAQAMIKRDSESLPSFLSWYFSNHSENCSCICCESVFLEMDGNFVTASVRCVRLS